MVIVALLYIYSNNKCVNVIQCLTLIVCFRRINHMVVKKTICIHPLMYNQVALGTIYSLYVSNHWTNRQRMTRNARLMEENRVKGTTKSC